MKSMIVRTRMAPSPTGEYHVGHIATLLKNYAFAKKNHGQFILRIEDTDQVRKVEGAVENILKVIRAYGLDWDEGPDKGGPFAPYVQSERLEIYKAHAQELVAKGKAYYCTCTQQRLDEVRTNLQRQHLPPMYDRYCLNRQTEVLEEIKQGKSSVIRLKVPRDQTIKFTDLIRGEIVVQSNILDDQVLLKSDGYPTYHLGVVVDDYLMNITHILRGEEWISSTPKHILLYQAFGWDLPIYAHIPIFLNPDGKGKMSKRKGTVSAQSFLDDGYLPEALLNFFMILGWSPKDQRDIVTLAEYIQEFDPQDISMKSVSFDINKLNWLNGQWIRRLSDQDILNRVKNFLPKSVPEKSFQALWPHYKERLVKLSELTYLTQYLYQEPQIDPKILLKEAKMSAPELTAYFQQVISVLNSLNTWDITAVETALRDLQIKLNLKPRPAFMTLRLAVTGQSATPPLFDILAVLGKKIVIQRMEKVINLLK